MGNLADPEDQFDVGGEQEDDNDILEDVFEPG